MLILEGGRSFLILYHNEPNIDSKNSIQKDIKTKIPYG